MAEFGAFDTLNAWLLASETDVILTAEADRLTERANRWPVFSDPVIVLLPAGHALAAPGGLTVGQLGAHPLVGRLEGAAGPFSSNLTPQDIDPDQQQDASHAQLQLRHGTPICDQKIGSYGVAC